MDCLTNCKKLKYCAESNINHVNKYTFSGGPFVTWLEDKKRYFLIGSLHGSLQDCNCQVSEEGCLPTLLTRIDECSVLKFIRKTIWNETLDCECMNS